MRRRTFLASAAALAALPLRAEDSPPSDRLLLVVLADGGWDPTRVMQPAFNIADMEPDAEVASLGDLRFVDHPNRPSVRRFLERNLDRTAFVNGLLVPSVSHGVCRGMLLTGTRSASGADWTTRVARVGVESYPLPHVVLSGPAYAGESPLAVARVGSERQLMALLDGSALDALEPAPTRPGAEASALIEARLAAQDLSLGDSLTRSLRSSALGGLERLQQLRALPGLEELYDPSTRADPWAWAVTALAAGVCRCVTLTWPSSGVLRWDSHAQNDESQSERFEDLFDRLDQLMDTLATTTDGAGVPLDRRVTVAVLSEMGRSPLLNTVAGKDHWPVTSAVLCGAGVLGGRSIGGINEDFRALGVNRSTGSLSDAEDPITPETLGATLLALAGVEPASELPGVEPLWPLVG